MKLMQIVIRQHAGEHSIFAQDAFDEEIGRVTPINFWPAPGSILSTAIARLSAVKIVEEGKAADLSFDVVTKDCDEKSLTADILIRQIVGQVFQVSEIPEQRADDQ